jgi:hypothetical protein
MMSHQKKLLVRGTDQQIDLTLGIEHSSMSGYHTRHHTAHYRSNRLQSMDSSFKLKMSPS